MHLLSIEEEGFISVHFFDLRTVRREHDKRRRQGRFCFRPPNGGFEGNLIAD